MIRKEGGRTDINLRWMGLEPMYIHLNYLVSRTYPATDDIS